MEAWVHNDEWPTLSNCNLTTLQLATAALCWEFIGYILSSEHRHPGVMLNGGSGQETAASSSGVTGSDPVVGNAAAAHRSYDCYMAFVPTITPSLFNMGDATFVAANIDTTQHVSGQVG